MNAFCVRWPSAPQIAINRPGTFWASYKATYPIRKQPREPRRQLRRQYQSRSRQTERRGPRPGSPNTAAQAGAPGLRRDRTGVNCNLSDRRLCLVRLAACRTTNRHLSPCRSRPQRTTDDRRDRYRTHRHGRSHRYTDRPTECNRVRGSCWRGTTRTPSLRGD